MLKYPDTLNRYLDGKYGTRYGLHDDGAPFIAPDHANVIHTSARSVGSFATGKKNAVNDVGENVRYALVYYDRTSVFSFLNPILISRVPSLHLNNHNHRRRYSGIVVIMHHSSNSPIVKISNSK